MQAALVATLVGLGSIQVQIPSTPPLALGYRAFSAASYWNSPLPLDAPVDPRSRAMVAYLERDSAYDHIRLAGTESDGGWGEPIYWARPTDPVYNVRSTRYDLPNEFSSIRIPLGARPAATPDRQMTIYDLLGGGVYKLWQARYDPGSDTWTAGGGSFYYLRSNGLHGSLKESDEPRNDGHRGVPPAIHAVRWDEIRTGAIDHVLKVSINTPAMRHAWPMIGSDGDSLDPSAPPQGARLRIKPSVDLSQLDLSPAALVLATALQRYGVIVGDSSGAAVSMKLENTVQEGRGARWEGVLAADSLKAIPFDMFEFVKTGYRRG
ncbi:MAG: hypothetical protein M3280_09565 [Actinomycetota bacterium]|nr:hypothetical protein [Actinomycetota bacterium]